MRRPWVAGNWKMHHLTQDALSFSEALPAASDRWSDVDTALFVPAPLLPTMARALSGTRVRLGGQTCHEAREGAFTGELSALLLADVGCSAVLVGHSERRTLFGETNSSTGKRVLAALEAGLEPVLCIGETAEEREAANTTEVLRSQLEAGLGHLGADQAQNVSLAYEPVWAIGTGKTATPELAEESHSYIRGWLDQQFGGELADQCRILYGGSAKPENLGELLAQPNIDGGLVGGASLKADSFIALMEAASMQRPRGV